MKWLCGIVAAAVLSFPAPALAQSAGLADLVSDLILRGVTLPGAGDPGSPHAGHFTLGNPTFGGSQGASRPDLAAIGAIEAFGDRMRNQFANFPLGSSTGGLTYTLDLSTGTYARGSNSFGPAFTERALTVGRNKLSVGGAYQHSTFDSFGGEDLRDRSIRFYLPHTDCCSAAAPPPSSNVPGFEGDLLEAALSLKATTDTFSGFFNYGITNNWDIGVSVPVTRVDLQADVRATIIRLSTAATPLVHTFSQNQDSTQTIFAESGTATGIGDLVVRTKYNFAGTAGGGVAAAVDLRLPTGDEADLLGLGTTQAKLFLIASGGTGRVSPHVNAGYTISGKGDAGDTLVFQSLGASDEFNYAGGVEFVASPRLTILGDFIGRTLIDAGKLSIEQKSFDYRVGAGSTAAVPLQTSTINPLTGEPYRQLALSSGNLNLMLASAGAKFNAVGNLLIGGNVLFPLNKDGLRDTLTFAIGVDYAF